MTSLLDADTSKKQQMFMQDIINKGMSPMAFIQFLNTKKSGLGHDLTNFTVDEFRQYIDEFHQNPVMKPEKKVDENATMPEQMQVLPQEEDEAQVEQKPMTLEVNTQIVE